MSEELRECPFCGGTRSISVLNFFTGGSYRKCDICGAEASEGKTPEEAAGLWNTRPTEDALKAEVERLKSVLRGIVVLCDGYTNSRRKKEDINHTIYWVRKLARDLSINNNTDVSTKESEGEDES